MNNRRNFIRNSSLGLLAGIGIAGCNEAKQSVNVPNVSLKSSVEIPKDLTILFQGDSITDGGRDRATLEPNRGNALGGGYVKHIAFNLLGSHPGKNIKIYNRGISGHKVPQLDARWDEDCLNLKPDLMSLMIGVNDYWHTLDFDYKGTAQSYNDQLRALLDKTFDALPNLKLIMLEPFAVAGGSAITEAWNRDFTPYRKIARDVAAEYKATLIPTHTLFQDALKKAPVDYWCPDGVHPSLAGGHLMAEAWLDAFGSIYA